MEAWRKTALCRALLVLLIVASGVTVSIAQDEKCWVNDDGHHPICVTEDCSMTCRDHGHVDGRCNWPWGFGHRLLPHCQCLQANCH
ncbi:hypothetical protein BS78_03G323800 [Paspalum vaginatum]|nr:hypothetical protein BS78_03G323800 [Paspalum vaginatum]